MGEQFGPNTYFYHENAKKTTYAFLDIFNEFKIRRWDKNKKVRDEISVKVLYGSLERSSYMNSQTQKQQRFERVPLIHVNLTSLVIDKDRVGPMRTEKYNHYWAGRPESEYYDYAALLPIPYNYNYTITIIAKYQEDIFQIIEQIVPLFNFHRVVKYRHPLFRNIIISNPVSILEYPNFDFATTYSADENRGLLAVPITFKVEGWLTREKYDYSEYKPINHIITNFIIANQRALKIDIIGDPKIQIMAFDHIINGIFKEGDIIKGNINNYEAEIINVDITPIKIDYNIIETISPNKIIINNKPDLNIGASIVLTGNNIEDNNKEYTIKKITKIINDEYEIEVDQNNIYSENPGSGIINSNYDFYTETNTIEYVGEQNKQLSYEILKTISPDTIELQIPNEDLLIGNKIIISSSNNNNGNYTVKSIDNTIITVEEQTIIDDNIKNGYVTEANSYYSKDTINYIIVRFNEEGQTFKTGEDIYIGSQYKTKCNLCKYWDGKFEEIFTYNPEDEPGIWPN